MQYAVRLPISDPALQGAHIEQPAEQAPPGRVTRIPAFDMLRGIAACAVFLAHALERLWPAYRGVAATMFDPGHFGVVIFFLSSGYIIPRSLERNPSLRAFWIKRGFRLYPLYWVNVALCAVCGLAGVGWFGQVLASRPGPTIAANLTMLQLFLGYPYLNTVYWTLTAELLFYLLYTALVMLGARGRVVPLAVSLLVATNIAEVLTPGLDGLIYLRPLSLIVLGSALAWWEQHPSPWIFRLSVVALPFLTEPQPSVLTARLLALLCFGWLVWKASPSWPPAGLFLGRISYSIYLLHPLVLAVIGVHFHSWWTFAVWAIVTLAGATLTFRWVEQPAIAWGQALARRTYTKPE